MKKKQHSKSHVVYMQYEFDVMDGRAKVKVRRETTGSASISLRRNF